MLAYQPGAAQVEAVDRQLHHRDQFLEEIKDRLLQAQNTMKAYQDQSRRELSFEPGEWAWLRLRQRSAIGIKEAAASKLSPRSYGPFQVLAKVGSVSYKLQLPARAKIHDVFHVSSIKKFVGDPPNQIVPLPDILRGHVVPSPEKVLRARLNRGRWELLVKWQGCSTADTSWQDLEEFKKLYPSVQLEDDLFLGGEVL